MVKRWSKCDNLESKHSLKPGKKICIRFLFVFLRPWQTSGVTKSMESSLNLHITMTHAKQHINHSVKSYETINDSRLK